MTATTWSRVGTRSCQLVHLWTMVVAVGGRAVISCWVTYRKRTSQRRTALTSGVVQRMACSASTTLRRPHLRMHQAYLRRIPGLRCKHLSRSRGNRSHSNHSGGRPRRRSRNRCRSRSHGSRNCTESDHAPNTMEISGLPMMTAKGRAGVPGTGTGRTLALARGRIRTRLLRRVTRGARAAMTVIATVVIVVVVIAVILRRELGEGGVATGTSGQRALLKAPLAVQNGIAGDVGAPARARVRVRVRRCEKRWSTS